MSIIRAILVSTIVLASIVCIFHVYTIHMYILSMEELQFMRSCMEADRVIVLDREWLIDGGDKNLNRVLFCGQFLLSETNNETKLAIYLDESSVDDYWRRSDEVIKLWMNWG